MTKGKLKFVLYANPNNVTNYAYKVVGAQEVNDILRSAKLYPDSYRILHLGRGNEEDINKACATFGHFRFV